MFKKIISLILVCNLALPNGFIFKIQQAKAEDRGLQNYRNASTQNAPAGQLVSIPDLTGNTGSATASISIQVPPGRLGIEPQVSINYDSQNKNSIVGFGWNLELGKIYRSTKFGMPKYNDTDTFVSSAIGSGDLVYSDGNYYEKIMRSAAKFTRSGNSWIVYDKSGTKYYFGSTAASQQAGPSSNIFAWYLDRIEDLHGNYLTITYTTDQNSLYPDEIRYSGNTPNQMSPAGLVKFNYETRSDSFSNYSSGLAQITAKRLTNIEVKFNNELTRKYVLSYAATSADYPLSRLQQVTQYGSDGTTSLPSVTFNYQQNSSSYSNNTTSLPAVFLDNVNGSILDIGWRLADINRDGLIDAIRSFSIYDGSNNSETFTKAIYLNTKTGWVPDTTGWGATLPNIAFITERRIPTWSYFIGHWFEDTGSRLVDVNGDGLTDIVQSRTITYRRAQDCGGEFVQSVEKNVYINNGSGWTRSDSWSAAIPYDLITQKIDFPSDGTCRYTFVQGYNEDVGTRLIDVNGDGLVDFVRADNYSINSSDYSTKGVYLNTGTGWTQASIAIPEYFVNRTVTRPYGSTDEFRRTSDLGIRFADLNSDGLIDIVKGIINRNYNTCYCDTSETFERGAYLNTGNGWTSSPSWTSTIPGAFTEHTSQNCASYIENWDEDTGTRLADINGDGLVDFVRSRSMNGADERATYINNGSGFVASTWKAPEYLISQTTSCYKPNGDRAYATRVNTDTGYRTEDINADGIVDFIKSSYDTYWGQVTKNASMLNSGALTTQPNLLTSVNNGLGGVTEFSYTPTTQGYNFSDYDGSGAKNWLGFPIDVVTKRRIIDRGINQFDYNYTYYDGVYDYQDREYRGFHPIITTYPDNSYERNYYLQTDTFKGMHYFTYTYDTAGNIISFLAKYPANRDVRGGKFPYYSAETKVLTDPNNFANKKSHRVDYVYDDYGNVTDVYDSGEFNYDTGNVMPGDEKVTHNQYVYNINNWLLNRLSKTETLDTNNQKVSESFNYYDNNTSYTDTPTKGDLTKKEYWLDGGINPTEQFTYDTFGHQLTSTDANNHTSTTTFENTYQLYPQFVTNAKNHTSYFSYDPKFGVVTSVTDPNQNTTTSEYDVFGRTTKVIAPYDSSAFPTTSYTYDLSTQPIKLTAKQRTTAGTDTGILTGVSFYDGFGRSLQTKKTSAGNDAIVTSSVVYDFMGKVSKSYLPYYIPSLTTYTATPDTNQKTTSQYDVLGRLTRVDYPDSTFETFTFDLWDQTLTDRNGRSKKLHLDAYGRTKSVDEINGTETYTTNYAYDTFGKLLSITDQLGNVTSLEYDTLGRKESMNDPDMGLWSYTYDPVGNLLSQTDAKGQTVDFTYDELNRVLAKNYSNSDPVTYEYDDVNVSNSKGKLTKVTDDNGYTSSTYDQRGRETSTTRNIDLTDYTVSKTYDSADRLKSLTYPDGELINYTYNTQGLLKSLQSSLGNYISNVSYDDKDRLTQIAYTNSAVTNFEYDPSTMRLKRLLTKDKNQTNIQDNNYTYDNVGNVLTISDAVRQTAQTFGYDGLYRLSSATGPYGNQSYSYDAIGNILTKNGATYTYGSTKPHAVTSTSAGFMATYDDNGNMATQVSKILSYDEDNRLVRFVDSNNYPDTKFFYDWSGNRVKKQNTTRYRKCLYPPAHMNNIDPTDPSDTPAGSAASGAAAQKTLTATSAKTTAALAANVSTDDVSSGSNNSSANMATPYGCHWAISTASTIYIGNLFEKEGTKIRKHYYLGGKKIATRISPSTLYYLHSDHLQSTSVTTNASGLFMGLTEYKPFGEYYTDGNTALRYKYNDKELDNETGLYYYGARYYSPALGRFISADSITPSWYAPQSINRYSYVMNNPMKYIDPTGHWEVSWSTVATGVSDMALGVGLTSAGLIIAPSSLITGPVGATATAGLLSAGVTYGTMGFVEAGIGALGGKLDVGIVETVEVSLVGAIAGYGVGNKEAGMAMGQSIYDGQEQSLEIVALMGYTANPVLTPFAPIYGAKLAAEDKLQIDQEKISRDGLKTQEALTSKHNSNIAEGATNQTAPTEKHVDKNPFDRWNPFAPENLPQGVCDGSANAGQGMSIAPPTTGNDSGGSGGGSTSGSGSGSGGSGTLGTRSSGETMSAGSAVWYQNVVW